MYLTYVDDAGDPGLKNSPTRHRVLVGVLVQERDWSQALDGLVDLRRRLQATYGIPMRARVKSHDFLRGTGCLRDLRLPFRTRYRMLRGIFRYQAQELPLRVFAVAIEKKSSQARGWEPSQAAWTFLLQRLQRFADEKDERALIVTEAELAQQTRRLVRQMRRYHRIPFRGGNEDRRVDIRRLVEDPLVGATVEESYWLQLADWNAYAALRSQHVEPNSRWTRDLWDSLGTQRLEEVSRLKGGPPGIVHYP